MQHIETLSYQHVSILAVAYQISTEIIEGAINVNNSASEKPLKRKANKHSGKQSIMKNGGDMLVAYNGGRRQQSK